jgi:hypothetical protein
VVEFYLKLKLILRIITNLSYICWEIDNFVIKSDFFRRFFICIKNILKKLSCYHDNNFGYFMFGKYNGFVSKARAKIRYYKDVTLCENYVRDFFIAAILPVSVNSSYSASIAMATIVFSLSAILPVSVMITCDHAR